jgi:hypothetical protein
MCRKAGGCESQSLADRTGETGGLPPVKGAPRQALFESNPKKTLNRVYLGFSILFLLHQKKPRFQSCFCYIKKHHPENFFPAELNWFGRFPPKFLLHHKKKPRNFFSCGACFAWAFSILFLLHQKTPRKKKFLRSLLVSGVFDPVFATSKKHPYIFFPAELTRFGRLQSDFATPTSTLLDLG